MRIVVGVDGSEGSFQALLVARREAQAHGAEIEVLQAWEPAFTAGWDYDLVLLEEVQGRAGTELADFVKETQDGLGAAVAMTSRAVRGRAADVLHEASESADLLVIGASGMGLVKRMLLGSVAAEVIQHASCPVLVVPCTSSHETQHRVAASLTAT
jgi:nucleotide-binding universal stress UspA family protein